MSANNCLMFCKAAKRARTVRTVKDILEHHSKVLVSLLITINLKYNFLQVSWHQLERNKHKFRNIAPSNTIKTHLDATTLTKGGPNLTLMG